MPVMLSASRLNDFLGCAHHTALWLAGETLPDENKASLELVRAKGFDHEANVLAALEAKHGQARRIPGAGPFEDRAAETKAAIEDGVPLIYQAALADNKWVGYPDFLVRHSQRPDGRWTYLPEDAKLSHRAKPTHLLQLNIYASLLGAMYEMPIASGTVHVGGGHPAEVFDLRKTSAIARRYMRTMEEFAALDERVTKPVRVSACGQCPFESRCEAEWRAADSLVFVAGISNSQIVKLERAGVSTLSALSELSDGYHIPQLAPETQAKIVAQARLQSGYQKTGSHTVEVLPLEQGRGFLTLPAPAPGDLFFDMEGDPLYPEGLEYLFGIWGPVETRGKDAFKAFWATDHVSEKSAFEDIMRFFKAHLARYPQAHIYHYAAYEVTAFKRLAMRYATMEAELDDMLRGQKFVDLYRVTRQALRASTESYSLKDLEKIYWGGRTGEVANASDSIVEYERWRETGDDGILETIRFYNEQDCISTKMLRDWLESHRPVDGDYAPLGADTSDDPSGNNKSAEREAFELRRRKIAERLRASNIENEAIRDLVSEIMWFHQRAAKPQWWAVFDRQTWSDDELIEDFESIGGLRLDPENPTYPDKKSLVATYLFPLQETKLSEGNACRIALTSEPAGTIAMLDREAGRIVLRRGAAKGDFPETCSLSPSGPIDSAVLAMSNVALAERLASGDVETDRALLDLLARRLPRLRGRKAGQEIIADGQELVDGAILAISQMDRTCLIIQGPPGTGKTYTTAHAIIALLKSGKRVGVTSNSHKAINNVLSAVEKEASRVSFDFVGAKKATGGNAETEFDGDFIVSVHSSGAISGAHQLVGATAFHFAREDQRGAFDYLFVDEAGQVALGNISAMSAAANNIVLVGDQMQLPQPVQGVHPGQSGLSCLDYAMQDHATVPPDRGILLNVSRRMHPDVCAFISDAIYDSRLTAHASTINRVLKIPKKADAVLKPSGIAFVSIGHEGCVQSSLEEAIAIRDLVRNILQQKRYNVAGEVKPFTLADILVVAPYNLQVNLLKQVLPDGARVGTVDKFQGQEAPVSIVSMATSSGETAPRGTEFLFNINRANVAISRAESLSILVCNDNLLDFVGHTIDDLRRLDIFARAEAVDFARAASS